MYVFTCTDKYIHLLELFFRDTGVVQLRPGLRRERLLLEPGDLPLHGGLPRRQKSHPRSVSQKLVCSRRETLRPRLTWILHYSSGFLAVLHWEANRPTFSLASGLCEEEGGQLTGCHSLPSFIITIVPLLYTGRPRRESY